MSQAPAGWYPQADGRQRYWDGQAWTEHFAPGAESQQQPVGPARQASSVETVGARFEAPAAWSVGSGDSVSTDGSAPAVAGGKRPWFKKKRVLIPAGLLAVVMFAAMASGGDDTSVNATPAAATTAVKAAVTPSVDPSVAAEKAKAEAAAKAKAAAEAKAKAAAAAKAKAAAAAKAKAAAAARTNPKSYASVAPRTYALMVKNPDDHVGKKYVVYGHVTQFDAATGNDTFLAGTAATKSADWYDYDINTLVSAEDEKLFANVVEDDLVTLYVEVLGSFSYDTQIGGNTTVPHLKAHMVKVTGSAG